LGEGVKHLQEAGMLRGDELGVVLASPGPNGAEHDRLAAVVALLATKESDPDKLVRGAFAGVGPQGSEPMVRGTFTSGLHGCLRHQPVNAASPATTRSV
jgi:hypothetical protein